jgi:hypothetical protein
MGNLNLMGQLAVHLRIQDKMSVAGLLVPYV